jgi:ABC-2 type transport system ATP-binding protein
MLAPQSAADPEHWMHIQAYLDSHSRLVAIETTGMDAVVLENVNKSFGPVRAVADLSARIPTGVVYGFLGPNGAGKTTTIRMIMNIIRPDSGKIEVLGDSSAGAARARVGYMPEERGLYRKMTVAKVLAYFASITGMHSSKIDRSVNEWLDRVELRDWAGKKVEELSRGMHQKLQFAVTAINDPELLILDEPFSGLDPINTDLLKSIIGEMKDRGRTVIFSTHAMHEAETLCDSIILINRGQIVLDGNLAAIRAKHKLHAVSVELEGQAGFINELPGVTGVIRSEQRIEITLSEQSDTQELLMELAKRTRVRVFEEKVPSLHEIFVSVVGRYGQDS